MSHQKYSRLLITFLLLLILLLTACDNTTPTPQPITYTPGCSVPNLIGHINQANSNPGPGIINLDPNCLYILTTADNSITINNHVIHNGLPVISSEITINGNMAMIDIQRAPGEPGFGHFYVNPTGDLELYDLTLSNGIRQLGGAVIVYEGDFFASSSYFFDNGVGPMDMENPAPGLGGAIYNESGRVRIIKNSLFRRNYASQPSVQGGDLGGAIYNKNGVLTVSSTTFGSNSSAGSGGAIYSEKDASDESGGLVVIDGSSFIGNWAVQDGGAISLINEMNGVIITNSDFSENQADEFGGAIFSEASDLTANFDNFEDNTAARGGAIFSKRLTEGSLSSLKIKRSLFINNAALEIGGAIFSENSDLTLERGDFQRNTASSCGAIGNGGHPDLNVVAGDLETVPRIASSSLITDSYFLINEATLTHGGAICHVMGDLSIQETLFSGNQAVSMGGALLLLDESELSGLELLVNSAERGGGIAVGYPANYTPGVTWTIPAYLTFNTSISNSSFRYNQAIFRGGGLWAHHRGWLRITKSLFASNTSDFTGGGIYQHEGDLYINNSTFSGNVASKGGGLYAYGELTSYPLLRIKHSTFAYNIATETSNGGNINNRRWGGGGLNIGGTVIIENTLITQNTSIDCQLVNAMDYAIADYTISGTVDSDGLCGAFLTEPNPMIAPLSISQGISFGTHALLPGSPLIDILPDCAGLTDDQRGVSRPQPQGGNCDPGAYEFDSANPPPTPPPPPPPPPAPEPESSSSLRCDLFDDLEFSLVMMSIPRGTTNLT
ncbi:MAG: hypothetical protein GQ562_10680, partial [Anaerolineales bacterium]|nr:hypothetical protein [Anaerolineales bacterium]